MSRKFRAKTFSMIAVVLMLISLLAPVAISAEANTTDKKVSASLAEQFNKEDKVTFIVEFDKKADTAKIAAQAKEQAKASLSAEKVELLQRDAVIHALKSTADKSQKEVYDFLASNDEVEEVKSFYITNSLVVTATEEVANEVAKFDEVSKLIPNEKITIDEPINQSKNNLLNEDVSWNVNQVNAPQVWEQGFDGTGVVVATIDSGVQWDHPALIEKYRGYNSETGEVNHEASFYDVVGEETEAYDDHGHGTHVTGTMVGDTVGVAPGAEWIAVKALDSSNSGYLEDFIAAAEWLLAPAGDSANAPDIINNSWGVPGAHPDDVDEFFRDVIVVWQDAGIFPLFASGNSGELGESSVNIPALYPEAFAVGATDANNALADFSSTGPSPYGDIKPDVVAPGVEIPSAYPGDRAAVSSGTSMATPAVSGVAALLLQANPDATVDELKDVLKNTATTLTDEQYPEAPSNGYGHGLVDALAAVEAITEEPAPEPEPEEIERISGSDRYDTAIEISKQGWADDSVDTVIVARGDDFSDALAGVPLAEALEVPILLTPSDKMLDKTLAEIDRLGAEEVLVLGGDVAVSEKAENTLDNAGLHVNRLKGDTRFETAAAIAEELTGGQSDKVVIANGMNYPDALSVGAFAAQEGTPILLTLDDELPEATQSAIESLGVTETVVVGGTKVVSEDVAGQLPEANRLSGSDRYGTNLAILEAYGVSSDALYVATGKDYADALTGAVLAAQGDTGVILVHDRVPAAIQSYLSESNVSDLTIFGGTVAVSDAVKEALAEFLK